MDSGSTFPREALTRRQFGTLVGGGALLLMGGGVYGVVARNQEQSAPEIVFPSGTLKVIRAGRFARLDARGHPASSNISAAASHLTAVTAASMGRRRDGGALLASTRLKDRADTHGHDAPAQAGGWPQPLNLTWGDVVVLEVMLRNSGPRPELFSPGQLRLKLMPSATTITPEDSNRRPGPLEPHGSENIIISYLAPHGFSDLALEYTDPRLDHDLQVALPLLPANEVGL